MVTKYFNTYPFDRERDEQMKNAKVYASIVCVLKSNDVAELEVAKIMNKYQNYISKVLFEKADFSIISSQVNRVNFALQDATMKESILNEFKMTTPEDIMNMLNIDPNTISENDSVDLETFGEDIELDKQIIKEEFFFILNRIK
jgi:hypothetical protein